MAKSPKSWSPFEDERFQEKLGDVLQAIHKHLSDSGAAEARLVNDLLVEVLDNETHLDGYVSSLEELIGWAQMAKDRLLKLQRTGK